MRRAVALVVALAACGERSQPSPLPQPGTASVAEDAPDTSLDPDRPELEEVPEEERIAAIEHAMNQLAPIASTCWAAAAADDFRLAGDVRAQIAIDRDAGPGAAIDITANSTDDDVLADCLSEVLAAYDWAPPLVGQTIELPFHFAAPAMQNVIDRRFVPRKTQSGVSIGVLLDERNTGNAGLSLFELEATGGARLQPREIERPEAWFITAGAVTVKTAGGADLALGVYDVLLLPAGARIEVLAGDEEPLRALVAVVPGGREGSARAGALPGKGTTMAVRARPPQPTVRRASAATYYVQPAMGVWLVVERAPTPKLALSFLALGPRVAVPPHVHAKETEALYVMSGGGTMTVAGTSIPVTQHSVVQVPPGVEHGFTGGADVTIAVQLYSPGGPEQRFKKPPAKLEKAPLPH